MGILTAPLIFLALVVMFIVINDKNHPGGFA